MAIKDLHSIQKVFLEVNVCTSSTAYELKEHMEDFLKASVFPYIESYFEALELPETTEVQIENIVLDLTSRETPDMADLAPQIKAQMDMLFQESRAETSSGKTLKLNMVAPVQKHADTLLYFLKHGSYPWWIQDITNPTVSVDALLYAAIEDTGFIEKLRQASRNEVVRKRIVFQFSNQFLSILLPKLSKSNRGLEFLKEAQVIHAMDMLPRRVRHEIWMHFTRIAIENSEEDFLAAMYKKPHFISTFSDRETEAMEVFTNVLKSIESVAIPSIEFVAEKPVEEPSPKSVEGSSSTVSDTTNLEFNLPERDAEVVFEMNGEANKDTNDLEVTFIPSEVSPLTTEAIEPIKPSEVSARAPESGIPDSNEENVDPTFENSNKKVKKRTSKVTTDSEESTPTTSKPVSLSEAIASPKLGVSEDNLEHEGTISNNSTNTNNATNSKNEEYSSIDSTTETDDKDTKENVQPSKTIRKPKELDEVTHTNKKTSEKEVLQRHPSDTNPLSSKTEFPSEAPEGHSPSNPITPSKNRNILEGETLPELITGASYYINNAGLVLLHPFIKPFLGNCELLHDKQIRDVHTAVHLLHFLATGNDMQSEHLHIMEKFLCGVPPDFPIDREVTLTDLLKEKAEELLKSVLEHLPQLKSTSIVLLRNEFLQRPGKLVLEEGNPKLIVEQKTQDILLDNLPWNLSLVKLPWHTKLCFVDW